jgi:hypothetical protein
MDEQELIKKLENVETPALSSASQQRQLKLVLVSARRSSWLGLILVTAPSLFLFCVILKYGFQVDLPWFSMVEEEMSFLDHTLFRFVPPLILVAAPLVGLALNLLAVLHFELDRGHRELRVTLKLKVLNLLIIGTCLLILTMIFTYAVAENGAAFLRGP